ncbi:helix-turn-helix domain-containing protein (plasmid) [Bradyrhizobium septentrionale]|uniref:Helix-turn-helix domain-containing protein n=1 Tax=Bradyrhizobium septentrionale TaxID=1404411 RepID=A0A974A6J8_9BRAD|nr:MULTISPECIES: helix-turn-helix domain-containing protein [Bradyrhizobium]MCK7664825.1 helix-turn-helix domain-containing protein [Bradyrhizobium sp. 2S1]UGY30318.1 helix-turn-helix domain-containing protein [Bradyrhizobium septentrionale]
MEQKQTRERLGFQLATARRDKGWTLSDLGQRTANAASRLSGIENGKFNVTVDALAQAGDAAGLTLTFVPTERLEEVMALIGKPSVPTAYPTAVRSLHDEVFIPDPSEEEERTSGYGRS